MEIVNLILNVAGVLLWINWLISPANASLGVPTTLLGTLRRAEQTNIRRWYVLALLPALLTIRAWAYWELSAANPWVPALNFEVFSVPFRTDIFKRAFSFSVLSFLLALALFCSWLLLLSVLNPRPTTPDPFGRFVRVLLGPIARFPRWLQVLLPLLIAVPVWLGVSYLLEWMRITPTPAHVWHRLEQGALIGLSSFLTWSHVLAVLLLLQFINTYVHLGEHPLWSYVNALTRTLLQPFRVIPMRFGKVDFTPLVALALIYLLSGGAERLLRWVNGKLPL